MHKLWKYISTNTGGIAVALQVWMLLEIVDLKVDVAKIQGSLENKISAQKQTNKQNQTKNENEKNTACYVSRLNFNARGWMRDGFTPRPDA